MRFEEALRILVQGLARKDADLPCREPPATRQLHQGGRVHVVADTGDEVLRKKPGAAGPAVSLLDAAADPRQPSRLLQRTNAQAMGLDTVENEIGRATSRGRGCRNV